MRYISAQTDDEKGQLEVSAPYNSDAVTVLDPFATFPRWDA